MMVDHPPPGAVILGPPQFETAGATLGAPVMPGYPQ
jgi:hypothetical protein